MVDNTYTLARGYTPPPPPPPPPPHIVIVIIKAMVQEDKWQLGHPLLPGGIGV